MKNKSIITIVICIFINLAQISAQLDSIQISTPKGLTFWAYEPPEIYDEEDKSDWSAYYAYYYPGATEINPPSTTSTYNCHGYAWHKSEGGSPVWIGWYSTSEEDRYWTDQSYVETNEASASKISYYNDDHSAIQTSTQGIYRSKWGNKVLMEHARDYGPEEYEMDYRKYYKLNPDINGSTSILCESQQRTFTSNTSISGSDYSWHKSDSYLTYVSGAGTTSYVVSGAGSGNGWIYLTITTPSGEVATTSTKSFWVGKPVITNKKVDGSTYYTAMAICPGNHYLTVTPIGEGAGTAVWSVPPGIVYMVGTNELDFTFPSNLSSVAITVTSTNSCGTCGNSSFYLTKKTYGCSKSLSLTLYPNPASDYVTITVIDEDLPLTESDDLNLVNTGDNKQDLNNPVTYTVNIYSSQSILLLTMKRTGKTFSIPLSNLKDGNYIVEVTDSKNTYTNQLIVKH